MKIYFDNCTEALIKDTKSYIKKGPKSVKLYDFLPSLKQAVISNEICPKGEFERGYLCRQFLREIVRFAEKQITGAYSLDATTQALLKSTKDYIESSKKQTENNRTIIVIRNVLVLKYNADIQNQNSGFSFNMINNNKPALQLKSYDYKKETTKFLYTALGVDIPKVEELYKMLDDKNALNSLGYNDYLQKRYKQIFVYTALKCLESMEV